MPSADGSSSARPNGTSSRSDQLAWYKSQYEQLEAELADFQASSRELEAELEKDIEASEKRERLLKEKVDSLKYEVEEWKTKYKQSKSEGNSAQNTLQKEITTLRDANRTLQLKLRDIEVANDDYERQARHTTSSLEDLESKYNVAIERAVLLEEEIRTGEQERENLRIENQRLRDELSDLKIETEIIHEKLRNAELQNSRRRKLISLRSPSTPQSPDLFNRSPASSIVSSPLFSTPTLKTSLMSATATPPSPPISESSSSLRKSMNAMPGFPLQKASASDASFGSRSLHGSRTQKYNNHSRATSYAFTNNRPTPSATNRPSLPKPKPKPNENTNKNNNNARSSGLPKSGSLYQIRGLIGKMQKLEERVQSAKSKLPPPSDSPSRTSSRSGSILAESPVASTITARRNSRKRLSGSSFSSSVRDGDSVPSYAPHSRPSFGARTQGDSRPSSRTSYSSHSSVSHSTHPSVTPSTRPESRQSRTKTPLGHYSTNPTTESRRPRSSLSNPSNPNGTVNGMAHIDEDEDLAMHMSLRARISEIRETRLPSISTPTGLKKRTPSGISGIPAPRTLRTSTGFDRLEGDMGPPERKSEITDLGETY
ncbi:nuclear distribution protein NudE [Aspergillus novofumigatus IBT 16806]|uniref:Nuclear distribution protein nude n=1 Tax=Aspergillus novofumigatus (strain IBT 16806) TaxID=1392255 RepID=A0A2I1CM52_ASPN1|nr:nuclear distribution protein nude [Aspergillus novofumigatus IBT 16806]PKX98693.1 nuclear distribution protein nude [Aspergillus novofumigatus IBT 16806]